jgi:uncharacterized protein (AIM24 family)
MTTHELAPSAPLNPRVLAGHSDNIPGNHYAYHLDLAEPWFIRKGAMIAYYGNVAFRSLQGDLSTQARHMVSEQFSAPLASGAYTLAEGAGALILGAGGRDINAFDLDDGNLTIRATNLLAVHHTLRIAQSVVPGYLTVLGTGRFLASSNGPVIFAEPPLRVDPQALVGWADCPSPNLHFDENWVSGFLSAVGYRMGMLSGEERQYEFVGEGTVLIQSSEKVLGSADIVQDIVGKLPGLGGGELGAVQASVAREIAGRRD